MRADPARPGENGWGKRVVVRKVRQDLENGTTAKTVVVDCWEYRTKTAILSKILIEMGTPVPARKEGIGDGVEEYVSVTLDLLTRIFALGDDEIRGYALALLADGGNVANIDMMQRQLRRVNRA